jgi:hypothetical protein
MSDWTRRVHRPLGSQELQQVRNAAEDLAQQARHTPGRARVVFQTIAEVAIIGSVVISGSLASIHLWKALFTKQRENRYEPTPGPADDGREPPRRRLAAAAGDGSAERRRSR